MKILIPLLFVSCVAFDQSQWRIDSIMEVKKQTVFVRAVKMDCDSVGYFAVNFRGMGKADIHTGMWLTYSKEGLTKRKIHVLLNR